MTKVNSFDDLNKNRHFVLNRLQMLHKLHTTYLEINVLDLRQAKSVEYGVFNKHIFCTHYTFIQCCDCKVN